MEHYVQHLKDNGALEKLTKEDQLTVDELQKTSLGKMCDIFAELDSGIPPETVNEFEMSLDEVGIEKDITIYSEVNRAFANPSGDRYAPEESKDAWQKTLLFFDKNLD